MAYKKVVFIRCAPMSKLIYESLFIEDLLERGFEVEYLETTLMYSKHIKAQEFTSFNSIIKINSSQKFKEYLIRQDTSNTIFIDLVLFNYKSFKLFLLLKKYNCKTGFFARYAGQSVNVRTSLKQKLNGIHRKLKNRIGLKIAYYFKKFGFLKTYDYLFVGGNKAVDSFFGSYFYKKDKKSAKIINVNASDYDRHLSLNINPTHLNEPYIIFLDQYLPYHPDFSIIEMKSLSPEIYYANLNRTFTQIEKVYNTKVKIAAHPKAYKYREENPFDGREIIFDKTIELVAGSSLVLVHYSTSINFAILYNKPIIFMLNKDFKDILPLPTKLIKEVSKSLKCPVVDIGVEFEKVHTEVDKVKYEDYKYKYMTSPESEMRLTKDIFIEFLLKG